MQAGKPEAVAALTAVCVYGAQGYPVVPNFLTSVRNVWPVAGPATFRALVLPVHRHLRLVPL